MMMSGRVCVRVHVSSLRKVNIRMCICTGGAWYDASVHCETYIKRFFFFLLTYISNDSSMFLLLLFFIIASHGR